MSRPSLPTLLLVALLAVAAAAETSPPPTHLELRPHGFSKAPVEVVVEASPAEGEPAAPALSVAATAPGVVELPLPPGGRWEVRVRGEGVWSPPVLVEAGDGVVARADLWREARWRARLRVPEGERLPEAVGLRVQSAEGGSRGARFEPTTVLCQVEKEGRLDCGLPRLAGLDVRLRAPGFASRFFWDVDLAAAAVHDLGTIDLRPGASVVGRVEVPAGFPLAAVEARLTPLVGAAPAASDGRASDQTAVTARPDRRGHLAIEGLSAGTYRLEVRHPDLAPYELAPVRVIAGGQTEVAETIVLAEPAPLRLLFDPPFDPHGGDWAVELSRLLGGGERSRVSADRTLGATAGFLETLAAPAVYEVRVLDSRGVRVATEEVTLDGRGEPHLLTVRPLFVDGLVTVGDEPLLARVTFRGSSTLEMDSDIEGRFGGYLPRAGEWDVEVTAIEPPVRRRVRAVEVEVGEGEDRAELHLRVPATILRGTVVGETGAPVADAVVTVTDPLHSTRDVTATSDGDGRFEIHGLDEGPLEARAELRRSGEEELSSRPETVELREGSEPEVRLVLAPHSRLRGRVVAADGNPVPHAGLEAIPYTSAGLLDALFAQPRSTDAAGRFDVSLPRSTAAVHLAVLAPGHPLTLREVELGDIGDVALGGAGGALTVELPTTVGEIPWADPSVPRPGLVVGNGIKLPLSLLVRWAGAHGISWSAEASQVTVPSLAPGRYAVCWFSAADWMLRAAAGSGCASGELAAGGTLALRLPPAPAAR